MELIELVSSHVTMPVIGVVLCALMVFTFGFSRSAAQPPSFTFEEKEKRNKKRSKQTKVKNAVNGNNKITESSAEVSSKAVSESPKARQPVLPSKPKSENRKEAAQDVKGDKNLKQVKREVLKGGIKTQNVQAGNAPPFKKETEEDGEWTTIQVSKKNKKQKPSKKKSNQQAEPGMEAHRESDATPEAEATDIAPVIAAVSPANVAVSPAIVAVSPAIVAVSPAIVAVSPAVVAVSQANLAVSPAIITDSPAIVTVSPAIITDSPAIVTDSLAIVTEAPTSPESNRIRNKKKKEKVAETNKSEEREDTRTGAIGSRPVSVEPCPPQSEENGTTKKKNKKDKKPVGEASSLPELVVPNDLQVSEATGKKEADPTLTLADAPNLPCTEQTKPAQKKNARDEIIQKEAFKTAPDMQISQPEKPETAADNSVICASSKAMTVGDVESDGSPCEEQQPVPVSASQPLVGISFDEIGDAWVDAAPKSKKKKSRRDN